MPTRFFETKTKILSAAAVIVLLGANFGFTYAQNVDQLAAQKEENRRKLDELNKQIKDYTKQIADTRSKANTLANEVSIFDKEIASTELQIQARETQIEDTELQISELEKLIEQKKNDIAENKKVLAELIVQLHEFDNNYVLKTTLGSESLSDFLDQVQYTQSFQDKVYQILQKIKDLKAKLEAQQHDLEVNLAKLNDLKEQLEISRASLQTQRTQKQELLTATRGVEKNYQKLLSTSQQEEDKLQQEIESLDAKIRAQLGNKSIPAAKGVLAWPIDGIITQKYGNTGFTALGYTFHNGLDIAAPAGEPIYAAADGTVIDTDMSSASYGNWVAIKHDISTAKGSNQIVTLYGHMRTFKVKPGQQVKQGDIIGYEGNTGNTTAKLYGPERGYHLHFTVYDIEGFGINKGAYSKTYGNYKVPYGYTYNPLEFLQ